MGARKASTSRKKMKSIFKEEMVGQIERERQTYNIYVTATGTYDDVNLKLVVNLDRYLLQEGLTASNTHIDKEWLPKKNRVEYTVSRNEIGSVMDEVFHFWVKKVAASIPSSLPA